MAWERNDPDPHRLEEIESPGNHCEVTGSMALTEKAGKTGSSRRGVARDQAKIEELSLRVAVSLARPQVV